MTAIALSDFITNRTSKKKLISDLGISSQCFYASYLKIAEELCDFIKDYPTLDGNQHKRIGLTDYQVWVIKNIFAMVRGGINKSQIVYADSDGFTVFNETYEEFLSKENYLATIESECNLVQTAELVIA